MAVKQKIYNKSLVTKMSEYIGPHMAKKFISIYCQVVGFIQQKLLGYKYLLAANQKRYSSNPVIEFASQQQLVTSNLRGN